MHASANPALVQNAEFTAMRPLTWPKEPTPGELMAAKRLFPPNFLHESWADYLFWDSEIEK